MKGLRMRGRQAVLWLCVLSLIISGMNDVFARGKRGKSSKKKKKASSGFWQPELEDALDWADEGQKPVLLAIIREDNAGDQAAAAKLQSWPSVAALVNKSFAAVKSTPEKKDIQQLAERLKIKTLPALVWLDWQGNTISWSPVPDSAAAVTDMINNWPATMSKVAKSLKDCVARGQKLLAAGRLHDAYLEFSTAAAFRGSDSATARKGCGQVKAAWQSLLDTAAKYPAGANERTIIVKGLRAETAGTNICAEFESKLTALPAVAAAAPKNPPPSGVLPPPAQPQKPEASAPPPAAVKAADAPSETAEEPALALPAADKTAAELAAAPFSAVQTGAAEGTGLSMACLEGRSDVRIQQAAVLIQDGLASYRKACGMERGSTRNQLLKTSYAKLEKSQNLLEETHPDTAMEKLMQEVGMMMYGCLKYQSL